jgi:hypothetical protein
MAIGAAGKTGVLEECHTVKAGLAQTGTACAE